MGLSKKKKYAALVRLLTSISVIGIGYGIGGTLGAGILTGVGINLTSDDLKVIRDRKWRKQWLDTLPNADIKLAIARSIEKAIDRLESQYFKQKHLRKGMEISQRNFFKKIKYNLQENIFTFLESDNAQEEFEFFFNEERDDIALASISLILADRSPIDILTATEQDIVAYLQQGVHTEVQRCFTAELKSNTRVWIAFQKTYLENITKGLANIQRDINDISLKLNNELSRSIEDIPKYLTRIPSINLKKDFIGRKSDLKRLRSRFSGAKSVRLVLVNGIGGIGKTTLATAYVQQYEKEYDHLLWIKRGEDIVASFALNEYLISSLRISFIKEEEIEHRFRRIMRNLNELPGRNLMVIDNAQEQIIEEHVYGLLPGTPKWSILLTSRLNLNGFDKISLDTLSFEDARKLFLRYFNGDYSEDDLKKLLEEVNNHTLTVELLAKLLDKMNGIIGLLELTKTLRNKQLNDPTLQEKIWTTYNGEERSIYIHLAKTFELTKLADKELWLLRQFVVLPPVHYTVLLLADILHEEVSGVNTILNSLSDKGWLSIHDDKSFSMHRVIRQVMSHTLKTKYEDIERLLKNMIQKTTLDSRHSFVSNNVPWLTYATFVEQFLVNENNELISLLQTNIALILRDLGQYEEALEYAKKAVVINEKILGLFDPQLANSYYIISLILRSLGKYDAALTYNWKDLGICTKILSETDIALANSYNNIAAIFLGQGKYEQAIHFSDKATSIYKHNLGERHQDMASAYNDKSLIYRTLGKYKEALGYSQKALDIYEALLEENHPNLATCYNNIALIYRSIGQYTLALQYNQKAITIYKTILDNEHPNLAKAYNNIALVYKELGEYEKALSYCIKAVTIAEKAYSDDYPYLGNVYNNLALLYSINGLYGKASDYVDQAIAIIESQMSSNHPMLATAYNNKAFIYRGLREFKESLEYHKKASHIIEIQLAPNHPNIAASYNNIALLYCDMEDYKTALEYHKKAIDIREGRSIGDDPFLAVSYSNISFVYFKLGDFRKALSFSEKAVTIQEAALEKQHPELLFTYENMIGIYKALEQFDKADEIGNRIRYNLY